MNAKQRKLAPAQTLDDVFSNLSPKPLMNREEFDAFYCEGVNQIRGNDVVQRMCLGLEHAFRSIQYKTLVTGHRGVGKSTELTRLQLRLEDKYCVVRFSVTSELDPVNFRPFDILLLIMALTAERTNQILQENESSESLPSNLLKDIWDWFASEKVTREEASRIAGSIEAGAGVKGESLWAQVFGLFTHIKGEVKYAHDRKKEIIEYRLSRISALIHLANRLLDECNRLLSQATGKEWLVIVEDFDKPGIPIEKVEDVFINNSNIFKSLHVHLVTTVPITLVYSQQAPFLPFTSPLSIADTPVFDVEHQPHQAGRQEIQAILKVRMDPRLFETAQMDRLIVASGGNLRDLFQLISHAAEDAILRQSKTISEKDVTHSINNLRNDYERRLGESPYDKIPITFDKKANRLKQIYEGDRKAGIPDDVLHSLLRARAVQEFNGKRWFGVHPLVVDILGEMGILQANDAGRILGGTE